MNLRKEKKILDALGIDRALTRIAHEIVEYNKGVVNIVMVGIRTGGVHLSKRIGKKIKEIEGAEIPIGIMDITMYRDDIGLLDQNPVVRKTEIPFSIDDKGVVLVDDVLFTGRSIRAAMDGLMDFGRPKNIQLAVLIDRGHRELPIRADYVGKNIPTSKDESVEVILSEEKGIDEVVVIE